MKPPRFIAALILCFASFLHAAENKPVKVFLLAGQSNMAGLGRFAELKPPYSEPFDRVQIWTRDLRWDLLGSEASMGSQKMFGPEIHFGHAIAKQFPAADIRLIKHAKSGSSLYEDWSPDSNGPKWARFLSVADPALADLEKSGLKYELAGMLWLQGESDAAKAKGDEYEKNLRNFIAKAREHFKTPGMPFIIARVRNDRFGREKGHADKVREAQVKVGESTPNAAWIDTDDCSMLAKPQGHYDTSGQAVIGARFAEAFAKIATKQGR